jgi:hypothetical protein
MELFAMPPRVQPLGCEQSLLEMARYKKLLLRREKQLNGVNLTNLLYGLHCSIISSKKLKKYTTTEEGEGREFSFLPFFNPFQHPYVT